MCDSLLDSAGHTRWITAPDWDTELKCDGDQVAVGACSGGGAGVTRTVQVTTSSILEENLL